VIKVGLIRWPTFIWKGYISRPPGPWRTYLFYRIKARVSIIHLLAPFLNMYPGSVGCESARQGNSHRSAGKLSMEVVADGESADDMGGRLEDGWLVRGSVPVCHGRIVLCFP